MIIGSMFFTPCPISGFLDVMVNVLSGWIVTNASAWNAGGVKPGRRPLREELGGIEVQREHRAAAGDGADANEGAA